MEPPRDHPYPDRPHRVYVALTNHCNRACPWCSMYSSPAGRRFMGERDYESALPSEFPFELQLEGGEPTAHPLFWRFVEIGRARSNCRRIIICTNGTRIPREPAKLDLWLRRLGVPFTLKVSVNHHLLDHDPGLLSLCGLLAARLPAGSIDDSLVLNVRRRRGVEDDDVRVLRAVEVAGLLPWSNVFFLQRYGLAKNEELWEEPFVVGMNFNLVNPDGATFGTNLVARAEAMRRLG